MNAGPYKPTDVRTVWPSIRHQVADCVAPELAEEVYHTLRSNEAVLYTYGKSFFIARTFTNDENLKKILFIWAVHCVDGSFRAILSPAVDDLARSIKADRIVFRGRRGFEKILPEYRPAYTEYCKDVTHE